MADLGHLELTEEVPYGSPRRLDLEAQVTRALMAHFGPVQITGINPVVSSGAADSRLELSGSTRSQRRLQRGMQQLRISWSGCEPCPEGGMSRCRCT